MYLVNVGKSPTKADKWYGYVLAYQGKTLYTIEGFGHSNENRHERDLTMFLEALARCKDCDLTIHTDSAYLFGGFHRLEKYKANNFITVKGKPVAHAEQWKEIYERTYGRSVIFSRGEHEFEHWIREEIKKREMAK